MLKKYRFGFILASVLLFIAPSATYAQQDLKVGVVNYNRILDAAPQRAEAIKKIRDEFIARKEALNKMQAELTALSDKYNKDALTMSADERDSYQKKYLQKEREFKWNLNIFEEDKKLRENEMNTSLNQVIVKAIQKIGQDEKYDIILADGIVFRSERVDLTDEVLELLKKQANTK